MKKKPSFLEQWEADGERVEEIAFAACADGLVCSPEELLELLFIFARYDEKSRGFLAERIAEETYPYSRDGQQAIEQMIGRAKKKGGVE